MRKIMLSILILSIVVFSFSGCAVFEFISDIIFHDDLEEYFAEWEENYNNKVAFVYYDQTLTFEGETFNFAKPVRDYYGLSVDNGVCDLITGYLKNPILCLHKGKVYIVFDRTYEGEGYRRQWDLLTVDIETSQVKVLNESSYVFSPLSVESYKTNVDSYYYNGVLYIYDGLRTVSYDLENEAFVECVAEEFIEYSSRSEYVLNVRNSGCIDFEIDILHSEEERMLDFDYLAKRNDYLYDLKEKITSGAEGFGSIESAIYILDVFAIDEDIYILIGVRDKDGDARILSFSYDFDKEKVVFVYSIFTSESLPYIVPIKVIRKE